MLSDVSLINTIMKINSDASYLFLFNTVIAINKYHLKHFSLDSEFYNENSSSIELNKKDNVVIISSQNLDEHYKYEDNINLIENSLCTTGVQ